MDSTTYILSRLNSEPETSRGRIEGMTEMSDGASLLRSSQPVYIKLRLQ